MRCAWCREDILPGDKYYHGGDSGDIHADCVNAYLADLAKYELTAAECAEILGLEEETREECVSTRRYGNRYAHAEI